jgi:hypothetical protein
VGGQHHAPAALPPGKNGDTRYTERRMSLRAELEDLEKTYLHRIIRSRAVKPCGTNRVTPLEHALLLCCRYMSYLVLTRYGRLPLNVVGKFRF